jgi:hypothetical protein
MTQLPAQFDSGTAAPGSVEVPVLVTPVGPVASPEDSHHRETEAELVAPWAVLRESPPWLLSAVIHMMIVILLGLLLVQTEGGDSYTLEVSLDENLDGLDLETSDPLDLPDELLDEVTIASEAVPEISEPIEMPEVVPVTPNVAALSTQNIAYSIDSALIGRDAARRGEMAPGTGWTGETEDAVLEGLRWLARNQNKRGFWSLRGPFRDGCTSNENMEAATAMALLAFQGRGHTHQSPPDDPFGENVKRGWRWLLKQQHSDGHFYSSTAGDGRLYTHAMCTIALCELYGMTRDSEFRRPAQKAIDYCVEIQTKEGGWRYDPGRGNDLSVTGWFAMALQSARMAGLEVPSPTLDRLSKYLDSVQKEYGSQYAYQANAGAKLSMTAEGLLCRQYLGWERNDQRLLDGTGLLIQNLPTWDDQNVYYWYYATQVCHHMGGKEWETWNNEMRVLLPKHQHKSGRERGSWDPSGDRWGQMAGRLYTTCLSIYILEVYYRHLPIYGAELQ